MADLNGDAYTFSESTASSNSQPVYTSKQWTYQTDQSNGSYGNKQIIFDLSGFYNSQRFINPQEMVMVFPVVTAMSSIPHGANASYYAAGNNGLGAGPRISGLFDDNDGNVTNQYAMGYKSGYWHLINSIQVQVDGKDVIQLTPNINYHASFVANTTWSESDVRKHGPLTGFKPDSADTWTVNSNGAYSSRGYGVCNNGLPPNRKSEIYPNFLNGSGNGINLGAQAISTASSIRSNVGAGVPVQACEYLANDAFYDRMRSTNMMNACVQTPASFPASTTSSILTAIQSKSVATASVINDCLDNRMLYGATGMAPDLGEVGLVTATHSDSLYSSSCRQLQTTCIIRFKDVCDLFAKLPLTRGLYMRVTVNVNTGYIKVGASAPLPSALTALNVRKTTSAGLYPTYSAITQNTFPSTCPIMLSPLVVSAPCGTSETANIPGTAAFVSTFRLNSCIALYPGVACDAGTFNRDGLIVSVSISKPDGIHVASGLAAGQLVDHPLTQCRIYAPIVDMEPQLVNSYITQHKEQAVYYRDVLQFALTGVPVGQQFTYQLANGIVNAKRLVIIPFYHDDTTVTGWTAPGPIAGAADSWLAATSAAQFLATCNGSLAYGSGTVAPTKIPYEPISPFDSAPATCAPGSSLTNFNVLVSNMNVFQRNISYSFENFLEEMSPANALNGGLDTGLTSGLIDGAMWAQAYRYYVVDLSRRLAGDNTPKSLTIVGTNSSLYKLDYMCFVEYERHLSLDIESGHINVSSN